MLGWGGGRDSVDDRDGPAERRRSPGFDLDAARSRSRESEPRKDAAGGLRRIPCTAPSDARPSLGSGPRPGVLWCNRQVGGDFEAGFDRQTKSTYARIAPDVVPRRGDGRARPDGDLILAW